MGGRAHHGGRGHGRRNGGRRLAVLGRQRSTPGPLPDAGANTSRGLLYLPRVVLRHGHKVADCPVSGDIREFREQIVSYMIGASDDFSMQTAEKKNGGDG